MTDVLTDDRAALENQQSNSLPSPPTNPIHSFLLFLIMPLPHFSSISYQHSVSISSFVPSALLLPAIFVSSFLCPLLPILSPGWRKALPPQLCHVCPLSHDVPGRRGNVPNRWGEKRRGELLSFPDGCLWSYKGAFAFEAGIKIDLQHLLNELFPVNIQMVWVFLHLWECVCMRVLD